MEHVGKQPQDVFSTIHGPGYADIEGVGEHYTADAPVAEGYHIYAVEWEPESITFFFDDVLVGTITPKSDGVNGDWVFDHEFFIILNLAVGGGWPGSPDETTVFPQQMRVDYVRVYQ